MEDRIGVGVIGCGSISSVHLKAIEVIDELRLVAVCDCDQAKMQSVSRQFSCYGTTDIEDLLKVKEIEWVHILTPHNRHVDMAIAVMRSGKHVILEKPVGIQRNDLLRLKEVQEETGCKVGVILQNRFNPTTMKIKEYTQSDILGKYISGKGTLTWYRDENYYKESTWRGSKVTEGGGLLINQAIHTLDLLSYLTSRVTDVRADVGNYNHPYNDVEDIAMVELKHENGARSLFFGSNSFGVNSPIFLQLHYEKGILELKENTLYLIKDEERQVIASDDVEEGVKSYWGLGHERCIRYIYNHSGDQSSRVSLEEGLHATDIVLAAYISSERNEWIPLEHP